MWNLPSCTGTKSEYKHTTTTLSGVGTNVTLLDGGNSRDGINSSYATFTRTSSGTAGAADESIVTCAAFPTLPKASIGYLEVSILCRMWAQAAPTGGGDNKYSSSGIICEYSADAGSTWTTVSTVTTIRYLGSTFLSNDAYVAAVNSFSTTPATYGYGNDTGATTLFFAIYPALLSVGLQSLQIRFRANTIKDSVAGFASTIYCYINEITAYVS